MDGYLAALLRTLVLSVIFFLNYFHLEWTRGQAFVRWKWVKMVMMALVPTYILAEIIFDISRVTISILRTDPEHLQFRTILKDRRRYVCSIAGMSVVEDPEIEREPDATPQNIPTTSLMVKDATDLHEHTRPWTALLVLRLVLAMLAIIASIPLFWLLRPNDYYREYPMDRRFVSVATGSLACTVAILIILICRRQWSMLHLTSSPTEEKHPWWTFCAQLFTAALLDDVQLLNTYPYPRGGNILAWMLGIYPYHDSVWIQLILISGLNFLFWFWIFRAQIQERTRLNWTLIWSVLLGFIGVCGGVEQLVRLINDFDRW